MTVRGRLLASLTLVGIALVVAGVAVVLAYSWIDRQTTQAAAANRIVRSVFELSLLGHEYERYREPRAARQWQGAYERLGDNLGAMRAFERLPEEEVLLRRMTVDHDLVRQLFDKLTEDGSEEARRLAEQSLQLRLNVMVSDAHQLATVSNRRIVDQGRMLLMVLVAPLLVLTLVMVVLLRVNRRVLKGLSRVRHGLDLIGRGEFDSRIDVGGEDEFAQLAHGTNGMAEKLGDLYRQAEHRSEELSREIDERNRIEEEQARATKEIEDLYDHAPCGYHSLDANGRFVNINKTELDWLGYGRDEVVGKMRAQDLLMPDSAERFRLLFQEFKQTGILKDVELDFRRRDGGIFHGLLSASAIFDADGTFVMSRSALVDNGARKQAEQALQESEVRFRGAFETASHGMALVSPEGRFIKVNPALCQMIGYGEQELLATDFQTITHPDDLETDLGLVHALLNGEIDSYQLEKRYFHKDGAIVWILLSVSLVRSVDGAPVHFVAQIQDVTAQRTATEALVGAKKQAEAADRAKSDFLANMSHEIRTPMNAILGLAHIIGRSGLTPEQQDLANKITAAGRSLLSILNDILDFSKIEAGHMELEATDFRLATVFDDLATVMSVSGAAKNLEPVITFDPAIPRWLRGDPSRLQQVLVNLTGNAIKFTDEGEVAVRAELSKLAEDKIWVRFSVRDTGIGISGEQLQRLFKPFTQADTTMTRRFGGTGLGLTISKRLVELMGGSIGVDSEPGKGSEFWFTVPFDAALVEETEAGGFLENISVLIADDNESARQSLASTVAAMGWREDVVASGDEAIGRLQARSGDAQSYDLLLIDWQMPEMDGFEVSRRIREQSLADEAPIVIMVTGYGRDQALRSPHAPTVDGVLTKPVTPSSLYDAVAGIKAKRSGGIEPFLGTQGSGVHRRLKDIRVLVVEDNDINQEVARKILEQEGASVDVVGDGAEAVEWIRHHRGEMDIVLMDAQMPVMDGFEATRRIRHDLDENELPIIALTAGVRQSDRDRCIEAGMSDFVAKPLDVEKLVLAILRHAKPEEETPSPQRIDVPEDVPSSPLAAIPGLDLRQAMIRLGGDEQMLTSMLARLADATEGLADTVRTELTKGEAEQAARRMHTLRGSAGNIGLVQLASLASDLEAAIRDGRPDAVQCLVNDLETAIDDFRAVTAGIAVTGASSDEGAGPLQAEELRNLQESLRQRNFGAIEQFERLRPALKGTLSADDTQALATAMEKMDFKAALAALERLDPIPQ